MNAAGKIDIVFIVWKTLDVTGLVRWFKWILYWTGTITWPPSFILDYRLGASLGVFFCRCGSQYFGRNVPRFSGTANSIFGRTIYIFVFTDHQKSISKEIIVQNTNLSNYPVCNASAGNCYKSCLRTLISVNFPVVSVFIEFTEKFAVLVCNRPPQLTCKLTHFRSCDMKWRSLLAI